MITETQETHQSAQSRFTIEAKGVRYAIAASARRPVFRSCSDAVTQCSKISRESPCPIRRGPC